MSDSRESFNSIQNENSNENDFLTDIFESDFNRNSDDPMANRISSSNSPFYHSQASLQPLSAISNLTHSPQNHHSANMYDSPLLPSHNHNHLHIRSSRNSPILPSHIILDDDDFLDSHNEVRYGDRSPISQKYISDDENSLSLNPPLNPHQNRQMSESPNRSPRFPPSPQLVQSARRSKPFSTPHNTHDVSDNSEMDDEDDEDSEVDEDDELIESESDREPSSPLQPSTLLPSQHSQHSSVQHSSGDNVTLSESPTLAPFSPQSVQPSLPPVSAVPSLLPSVSDSTPSDLTPSNTSPSNTPPTLTEVKKLEEDNMDDNVSPVNTVMPATIKTAEDEEVEGEYYSGFSEEYLRLQQKLIDLTATLSSVEAKLKTEKDEVGKWKDKYQHIQGKFDLLSVAHTHLNVDDSVVSLRLENEQLTNTIAANNTKISQLVSEINSLRSELGETINSLKVLELEKHKTAHQLEPLKFRCSQLEEDNASLSQQVVSMKSEYSARSVEDASLLEDYTAKVSEYQSKLSNAQNTIIQMKQERVSAEHLYEERVHTLLAEIDDHLRAREELGRDKEKLTYKLNQSDALVLSLKKAQIEQEGKIQLLTRDVERSVRDKIVLNSDRELAVSEKTALENRLSALQDDYDILHSKHSHCDFTQTKLNEEIRSLHSQIDHLQTEAKNRIEGEELHHLINDLANTVASRVGGEGEGDVKEHVITVNGVKVSLHDFYEKYVELSQRHIALQREKSTMQHYIQQIQRELTEKAPIIEQQKQQHLRLSTNFASLTVEHNQCKQQVIQLNKIVADMKLKAEEDQANMEKLNQGNLDLSRQVRMLLKKQVVSSKSVASKNSVGADDQSSTDLIQNHLVVFNNIDELQANNSKLLVISRELTNTNTKLQTQLAEQSQRLEEYVDREVVYAELEDTVDTLKRQRNMLETKIEAIIEQKQREEDLRKQEDLAVQNSTVASNTISSLKSQITSFEERVDVLETAKRDAVLKVELLEAEVDSMYGKLKLRDLDHENEKSQWERTLTAEKQQTSEWRQKVARVEGDNARLTSAMNILKGEISNFHSQLEELTKTNTRLSDTSIQQEQELTKLHSENSRLKSECKIALNNHELVNNLYNKMKANEELLRAENHQLMEKYQQLELILKNFEIVQTSLTSDQKMAYNNIIAERDNLSAEVTKINSEYHSVRKQYLSLQDEKQKLLDQLALKSREVDVVSAKLDSVTETLSARETELADTKTSWTAEVSKLEKTIASIIGDGSSQGTHRDSGDSIQSSVEVATLKTTLSETQESLNTYKSDYELLCNQQKLYQDQIATLTDINTEQEQTISSMREEIKAQIAKKLHEIEAITLQKQSLQADLSVSQSKIDDLIRDSVVRETEVEKLNEEAHQFIIQRRALEEAHEASNAKYNLEIVAKTKECDELLAQLKDMSERSSHNSSKYQQEMINHAETVQELTAVKTRLTDLLRSSQTSISELTTSLAKSDGEIEVLRVELADMETRLQASVDKNDKLNQENLLLLDQLATRTKSSTKSSTPTLDRDQPSSDDSLSPLETDSTDKDQMILRFTNNMAFLKKEYQTISAALEASQRSVTQLELANKQLQEQIDAHTSSPSSDFSPTSTDSVDQFTTPLKPKSLSPSISSPVSTPFKPLATPFKSEQQSSHISLLSESNAHLRDEITKFKAKIDSLNSTISSHNLTIANLHQTMSLADADRSALASQHKLLELEHDRLKQRNKFLLEKMDKLTRTLMSESEKKELSEITLERDAIAKEKDQLIVELETLKLELESEKNHCADLLVSKNSLEAHNHLTKTELEACKLDVVHVTHKLEQLSVELKTAINMHQVLTNNYRLVVDENTRLASSIASNDSERIALLDKIDVLEVSEHLNAVERYNQANEAHLMLEEQLLNGNQVRAQLEASLLDCKNTITTLDAIIANQTLRLQEHEASHKSEHRALLEKTAKQVSDLNKLQTKYNSIFNEKVSLDDRLMLLTEDHEHLRTKTEQLDVENNTLKIEVETLKNTLTDVTGDLEQQKNLCQILNEQILSSEMQPMNDDGDMIEEDIVDVVDTIDDVVDDVVDNVDDIVDVVDDIVDVAHEDEVSTSDVMNEDETTVPVSPISPVSSVTSASSSGATKRRRESDNDSVVHSDSDVTASLSKRTRLSSDLSHSDSHSNSDSVPVLLPENPLQTSNSETEHMSVSEPILLEEDSQIDLDHIDDNTSQTTHDNTDDNSNEVISEVTGDNEPVEGEHVVEDSEGVENITEDLENVNHNVDSVPTLNTDMLTTLNTDDMLTMGDESNKESNDTVDVEHLDVDVDAIDIADVEFDSETSNDMNDLGDNDEKVESSSDLTVFPPHSPHSPLNSTPHDDQDDQDILIEQSPSTESPSTESPSTESMDSEEALSTTKETIEDMERMEDTKESSGEKDCNVDIDHASEDTPIHEDLDPVIIDTMSDNQVQPKQSETDLKNEDNNPDSNPNLSEIRESEELLNEDVSDLFDNESEGGSEGEGSYPYHYSGEGNIWGFEGEGEVDLTYLSENDQGDLLEDYLDTDEIRHETKDEYHSDPSHDVDQDSEDISNGQLDSNICDDEFDDTLDHNDNSNEI